MASTQADDLPLLLLKIARGHEQAWIESLRKAVPKSRRRFDLPMPPWVDEDYRQLARGYLAVFEEAVMKTGTVRREAYIDSIVEGMLKSGVPLDYLVHVSVASQAGLLVDWVAEVPFEQRPAAIDWLMGYFADYIADMMGAGTRFLARG